MPSNFPHYSNNGCTLHDLLKIRPDGAFWCYKTLPLTYDDSLSYYEVLCKNISLISKAMTDDVQHIEDMINCMTEFIQNMQNHLNQFIDEYNNNIDRIDGELIRIEGKFDDEVTRLDNKIDNETADIRANYVKRAGDTMTGNLNMNNNNINQVGNITIKTLQDENTSIYLTTSTSTSIPFFKMSSSSENITISPKKISFSPNGKISQLHTPTEDDEAANKKYVDDKVAALGTVLEYKGTKANIAALPQTGNKAGDVWYVESEQSAYAWVIDTANPQGHWEEFGPPINLEPYLKKDGSVPMTGNLDMGGHTVTNTAAPTNNTDIANKGYVDTKIGDININRFVLKSGDTMTGALDMSGNKITNVAAPTADNDSANKKYVDENGFQGIPVTRDEAYISTPTNVLSTKVLADPTAPPERPINKDQIAVYSETNQTYAEDNVTGTLLVADPHSAMEAVNKRTLDGYLSKANIDDNFERVTTSKGLNPGIENFIIVEPPTSSLPNSTTNQIIRTATDGRTYIPNIVIKNLVGVPGGDMEIRDKIYIKSLAIGTSGSSGTIYINNNSNISLGYDMTISMTNNIILNFPVPAPNLTSSITTISMGCVADNIPAILQIIPLVNLKPTIDLTAIILKCGNPTTDYECANKQYVDNNFIKVEGTPREGSTIAYINGKWTVVDHTNWTPFNQ